jgi:hypothetical protein
MRPLVRLTILLATHIAEVCSEYLDVIAHAVNTKRVLVKENVCFTLLGVGHNNQRAAWHACGVRHAGSWLASFN